jgi:hypothetical protein
MDSSLEPWLKALNQGRCKEEKISEEDKKPTLGGMRKKYLPGARLLPQGAVYHTAAVAGLGLNLLLHNRQVKASGTQQQF